MERDPDVEGFLALLTARRSPRTVEAYRRDLTALRAFLGKPVSSATTEQLELYTAQLRADGLSGATIARRTAAARSFYRHQQLLGAREDNPAAAVQLPRRDADAAEDALTGRGGAADRRRGRDAASFAPRPGPRRAALRRRPARLRGDRPRQGGRRPGRQARARDRQGQQGARRPVGRHAAEALRRYLSRGRPYLDRAQPARALPERPRRPAHPRGRLPDPAQAGRESRARPAPRSSASAPPLVRHSPARGRRRPPLRPGDAGPRRPRHDRALHPRNRSEASGVVFPGAPSCATFENGGPR